MKKYNNLFILVLLVLFVACTQHQNSTTDVTIKSKNIYWGDLHNHNAIGYARGSLERSYDIANSHLDFYCFTPHSTWHDMPVMPQNKHMKWVNGFKVTSNHWDEVVRMANENYRPGEFVSFIGYEWHSNSDGDVHVIYPGSKGQIFETPDIRTLQNFAKANNAILVPHHPGYKLNWRGQNWKTLDTTVSPVLEIFSEHGNAESDRALYRYIRHSMGGRYTVNTLQALLAQNVKIGVVASTDDHLGYPGAYGEGLTAVVADTLTRESILEAIKARHTYGVNMDRIELDFQLNGQLMGSVLPPVSNRNIKVNVIGKDVIDRVEILKNNRVIYRDHPVDRMVTDKSWDKPVLCRIEFGWGPWGDLDMPRVCDWSFDVHVKEGSIISATPCFQSGPYEEDRRNKLEKINENHYRVNSYTSRKQAYEERATNSIVLAIQGNSATTIELTMHAPTEQTISKTFSELKTSSDVFFTGPFTAESLLFHRLVFAENYETAFEYKDSSNSNEPAWYYVRVTQTNGSLAWSSPIWIE